MTRQTILVIDDSATIRRLVDSQLSPEGYRVVLAPNAEDGLKRVAELRPDLILLDHQLPGTTGLEVARKIAAQPELAHTPIVVSSTLRNKAYAEYTEVPNIVDMLPKPYTPELLKMTIANALDTGALVVASQSGGTAVPEVIDAEEDAALSGSFRGFSLREVLDFINNCGKSGTLEVESAADRTRFFIAEGRFAGVACPAVDPRDVGLSLPQSLQDLAPVLRYTVGGRTHSEADGLVELLDKKLIDPRLLRRLLRHQAAVLTWRCFQQELKSFRFDVEAKQPSLFGKLPLDASLAALLIDGALCCDESELTAAGADTAYVRRAVRGQNLDRSGLSATHMKLFGLLAEPATVADIAERSGLSVDETRRVLTGLVAADLVEQRANVRTQTVIALETDAEAARQLRSMFAGWDDRFSLRVVRDRLALQLVVKRSQPDLILVAEPSQQARELADELRTAPEVARSRWIAMTDKAEPTGEYDATLSLPFDRAELLRALTGASTRELAGTQA